MNNIMLDLETLGTRPGSAIRSVGAAAFELDGGEPAPTFYKKVRSMSCWVAGLTVDQGTLDWWARQPQEVQDELKVGTEDLRDVVTAFHNWFRQTGAQFVWCQGGNFDEQMWCAAARAVGVTTVPWKFWNARCTRTIYHAAGLDPRSVPREGAHHNALDDAVHQVRCVQLAHQMIRGKTDGQAAAG